MKVVAFSGGRSSAYMLYHLVHLGEKPDLVLFTNTGKERPETLDFIHECEQQIFPIKWLEYLPNSPGYKIVDFETAARDGEPFAELTQKRSYLPNRVTRLCTADLKIKPFEKFLRHNYPQKPYVKFLGFRYDEKHRADNVDVSKLPKGVTVRCPMVEWQITKLDVLDFWKTMPFDLKIHSAKGNCDLCFFKGWPKLVSILRQDGYELAEWWIEQEKKHNARFHPVHSYEKILYFAKNQLHMDFNDLEFGGFDDQTSCGSFMCTD